MPTRTCFHFRFQLGSAGRLPVMKDHQRVAKLDGNSRGVDQLKPGLITCAFHRRDSKKNIASLSTRVHRVLVQVGLQSADGVALAQY